MYILYHKARQNTNYEIKAKTVTHKIIYRLSGGKNNSKNEDTYDETKPYKLAAPSKKGYRFICWCSDSSLTNKITEIPKTATRKVTIYAKWKKVTVNKPVIVSVKRKADYVTGKYMQSEKVKGYEIRISTSPKFKIEGVNNPKLKEEAPPKSKE